jgi:hypothetical protein
MPALTDTDFFEAMIVIVSRMEIYPIMEPEGWVVGFTATCKANQYSKFLYTTVPLSETTDKTAEDIAFMSWQQLKPEFLEWGSFAVAKGPLLGQAVDFSKKGDEEITPTSE